MIDGAPRIAATLNHGAWRGRPEWLAKAEERQRKTSAPLIDGLDETAGNSRLGDDGGFTSLGNPYRRVPQTSAPCTCKIKVNPL
jgi:hypothetical protein